MARRQGRPKHHHALIRERMETLVTLVDGESVICPWSDRELAEQLDVHYTSVQYYRSQLGIASYGKRRRAYKENAATVSKDN